MKASAGSLVVARPRTTRLRRRATDLCGSRVHFRYEPAARTSFMKALAATKDGSVCSQVSRFCHNVSNGTGTLSRRQHLSIGESNELTLQMRWNYAKALYQDDCATLDDLREAVNTLEEVERTARRVLGGSHPLTRTFEDHLRDTRATLAARDVESLQNALGALGTA